MPMMTSTRKQKHLLSLRRQQEHLLLRLPPFPRPIAKCRLHLFHLQYRHNRQHCRNRQSQQSRSKRQRPLQNLVKLRSCTTMLWRSPTQHLDTRKKV